MYSIPTQRCIGAGSETALFVAKWLYDPDLPIRVMRSLAVQIFRAAKGHNVGCDDATKIVSLVNAGATAGDLDSVMSSDAEYLWGIQNLLRPVILGCFDDAATEESFESDLAKVNERCRSIRNANQGRLEFRKAMRPILQSLT